MGNIKLKQWIENIITELATNITKESFLDKLIEYGRREKNDQLKKQMRNVYKNAQYNQEYWIYLKRKIAKRKGWPIFAPHEREDIPPRIIPNRSDEKHCYYCKGALYSDIHISCIKCDWLICPYDNSCGCGFNYAKSKIDFW
ncbi:hypothetical protein [Salibacterium sp. K-3]